MPTAPVVVGPVTLASSSSSWAAATELATTSNAVDELDRFMWFLAGGMYSEPAPADVACTGPIERRLKPSDRRRYDGPCELAWRVDEKRHAQLARTPSVGSMRHRSGASARWLAALFTTTLPSPVSGR